MKKIKNIFKKGYSFIELSISMTILAAIISISLKAYSGHKSKSSIVSTEKKIYEIEKALKIFLDRNGYLPCPAPMLASENNTTTGNFGISSENFQSVSTLECVGTTAPNLLINNVGMIPVRTLGLADNYGYDEWGRKFVYRIARGLGRQSTFKNDQYRGDISIIDRNGLHRTPIEREYPNNFGAAYVIISYGPDGKGGYNADSTSQMTLPSSSEIQSANTNHTTKTYVKDMPLVGFDDIVSFKTKEQLIDSHVFTSQFKFNERTCENAEYISNRESFSFSSASTTSETQIADQIVKSSKAINTLCKADYKPCVFTPTNVKSENLKRWLDASDINANGTVPAHGAGITHWYFKSPIDSDFANTSVHRATLTTGTTAVYNGFANAGTLAKNSLRFLSNPSSFTFPTSFMNSPGSNYSIYLVVDLNLNTNSNYLSILRGNNDSTRPVEISLRDNIISQKKVINFRLTDGLRDLGLIIPDNNNQTPLIISVVFGVVPGIDNFKGRLRVYTKDGAEIVNHSGDLFDSTMGNVVTINPIGFDGRIGEILMYNTNVSDSDHYKIINYLKNRWFYNICP